jgi:hypothetical protein
VRGTPSGLWAAEEYAKLPGYDGEIVDQLMQGASALFLCHQRDGCLCGGWLQTHGVDNLLALRMHPVDRSTWGYDAGVDCYDSGAEAAAAGMADIAAPKPEARRKIDGLVRLLEAKGEG